MVEEFDDSPLGFMNQIRKTFKARARRLVRRLQHNATFGNVDCRILKMVSKKMDYGRIKKKTPKRTGVNQSSHKKGQEQGTHLKKLKSCYKTLDMSLTESSKSSSSLRWGRTTFGNSILPGKLVCLSYRQTTKS